MDKQCDGTTFRISPVDASDVSRGTMLERVDAAGVASPIARPAEMADYTAVGLGCATGSDGKPYFVAQYGELPFGCEFCEWFYLYDADGKQLTRSEPPLLTDETLPEGKQQTPNTAEYERMLVKLGIKHPEVTYFE